MITICLAVDSRDEASVVVAHINVELVEVEERADPISYTRGPKAIRFEPPSFSCFHRAIRVAATSLS